MEIAVVLPSTEPYSQFHGGALARWVHEVYPLIRGFNVDVFAPSCNTKYYSTLNLNPIRFSQISRKSSYKFIQRFYDFFNHYCYPYQIALKIKQKGYDVVHVMNYCYYVDIIKRINPNIRIILHLQNDQLSQLPTLKTRHLLSNVNLLLNCSDYLSNIAREVSSPENFYKIKTIYNGANPNEFNVTRKEFNLDQPIILFVGRLVKEKGVHLLIEAFKNIQNKIPNAKLHIVGSHFFGDSINSEYIQSLHDLTVDQPNIVFKGFVPNNGLLKYYNDATLFVCPSIWEEPFGMVIAEAMLSGLPVIASKRGGIPEVIDSCGILIDPLDVVKFAEIMSELLSDEEQLRMYSKLGKERIINMFLWEKIANDMKLILEDELN